MRKTFVLCLCIAGLAATAVAEEAVKLEASAWEQLAGTWEFKDGEASFAATGQSGAAMLKHATLHDFDISFEVMVKDAVAMVAFRAHHEPEMAKAAKRIQLGAPGLYGPMFMAGSDQSAMGIFDEVAADTFEGTEGGFAGGEWHTVRVKAEGTKWQMWVDGDDRGQYEDERFLYGGLVLGALSLGENPEARVAFRKFQLKDEGRGGKWRPLFNGKDTSGWKEWGEEKWTVEDGVIYGRSGEKKSEGYLATEETFTDFHVRGEFKMLGEGNFGLFFHSTITPKPEDNFPVIAGVQGEVEPGYPSSTGWLYESYKRGWLVEPPKNTLAAYVLDPKGWNEIAIRSKGKHLTTWVNGVRALDFEDPAPNLTEGSFALQLHTGGVDGIAWKELHVAED